MKATWITLSVFALVCLFRVTPCDASTFLYTNSPCVYLIVSNSVSQTATLLAPTGTFSGTLAVPVYVKSTLFNVTAIAPDAFKDCVGMTSLALDASSKVASIGAGAFWGCTNLTSVTLRDSLTALGASAFLGCSALTNVNLSVATGLTAVAEQTFCGCSALASITFPSSVTNLGDSVFQNCSALSAVAVPSSVSAISDAAFQGCRKLASASLPGATTLGDNAFEGAGLAAITIPVGLTNIAQGAFADCTNLVAVTYAGSPVTIGSGAFKNCSSLTNLPAAASLTDIASTAFEGCLRLKSVTLPAGVRDIANNLFENCTSLVSVTSAGTITNVGEFAFANALNLTNVTFRGNAPTADTTCFVEATNVFVYYYKGTSGWGNLLAGRPTVMLGSSGTVEALSFAAWAVRSGLSTVTGLCDATLATLFTAASPSVTGLANGAVYAFGGNLKPDDQTSLLRVVFAADGTPIVETPAVCDGAGNFVTAAVEGTSDLSLGTWNLAVNGVTLADATRAGYTPARVNGLLTATAFFRLKVTLGD